MTNGIQSLNAYGTDPYFMQALNSYNPSMYGMQNYAGAPQVTTPTDLQVPETSNTSATTETKSTPKEKESHTGLWVAGTVVAGAATLLYASKKGNGKGIKAGFKNIYQGLKNAVQGKKNKVLNKAGKNIQSYTVTGADGSKYLFKQGQTKPHMIINQSQTVLEGNKLTKQLGKTKAQELINGLDISSKDVKTIGRTISDGKHKFQMIYDKNGKVVKVLSQIEDNTRPLDLTKFKAKHGELIKQAETFSKHLEKVEISIPNATGFEKLTKDITLNVNGGKLNSINYQTANGTIQEITDQKILADLEKKYSKEIKQIMETQGETPITDRIYEYTQKLKNGTRTYQFNGADRKITQTTRNINHTYTQTEKINQILGQNNLGEELEEMVKSGTIKGNYNLGEFVYQEGNGPAFNIINGNLNSITDNGRTIKGKDEISKWLENAENSNELDKILALLQ